MEAASAVLGRRRPALLLAALCCFCSPLRAEDGNRDDNVTGILDGLLFNYDKRLRPNFGGQPVDVGITMFVLDVASISEKNMDYTLNFYLRLFWEDPRLKYEEKPGLEAISLGAGFSDHIWLPDVFVVNEKRANIGSPHLSDEFVRIKPSGAVLRSVRISATASCPMHLQYFPMDRQMCSLDLESYGHTMSDVRFRWKDGASSVGVDSTIMLPQFSLVGFRQRTMEISLSSGNYSRLACEFQFARRMGSYVVQIYLPSSLIVVISWATFWLERGPLSTTTRLSLGAIAFLILTALTSFTNAHLPRVAYLKATDLYLGVCHFMVFAALMEYVIICYMLKRLQANKARLLAIHQLANDQNKVHFEVTKTEAANGRAAVGEEELGGEVITSGVGPADLDKYSRILFPVVFVCFNLVYWVIYLHIGGTPVKDMVLL